MRFSGDARPDAAADQVCYPPAAAPRAAAALPPQRLDLGGRGRSPHGTRGTRGHEHGTHGEAPGHLSVCLCLPVSNTAYGSVSVLQSDSVCVIAPVSRRDLRPLDLYELTAMDRWSI